MILCKKNDRWYLAQRYNRTASGCALDVGPKMPHEDGFKPLPPIGIVLYKTVQTLEGITFFPELRYKGYRVVPRNFHPESEDPLLKCHLDLCELGGKEVMDVVRWLIDDLKRDGWEWDMREGGTRYVNVDDLDKTEGRPPSGMF